MEEKNISIYTQLKTKDVLIKMGFCDGCIHEILTSGVFNLPILKTTTNFDVEDAMELAEEIDDFIQSTYVDYMYELASYDSSLKHIKFGAGTKNYIVNELLAAVKNPNNINKDIMVYRTPEVIITDKIRDIIPNKIFEAMSVQAWVTVKEE